MSNRYTEIQSLYGLLSSQDQEKIRKASFLMPYTVKDLMYALNTKNYVKDLTVQEAIDLYLIFEGDEHDTSIIDFAYKIFKRV